MRPDVRVEEALEPREPLRHFKPPAWIERKGHVELDLERPIGGEGRNSWDHDRPRAAREEERAPVDRHDPPRRAPLRLAALAGASGSVLPPRPVRQRGDPAAGLETLERARDRTGRADAA